MFSLKVKFTATNKKLPIFSHYRPDWTSKNKPEYNCAALSFDDKELINPGETHICILTPMMPDLWRKVKIGDVLKCMEGSKEVGEALVLEIEV